ncbi:hypothetical protein BDZ89DRAFT_1170836 [Hymenopellis radicata]|nr:hypothetical protein BDZ89DRAFT_1170836 [Hymenopellis radicata]
MSRRVSRTDLEQQLKMVSGIKLDFKEIPQHPEVQDLLNWELYEFTVRRGTIAGSTSPVKTPRGGSKRKQSRSNQESPRADMSATAPPRTTTQRTVGSTAATAKRHTTRATTTYDRHIRKDLILRRTTLLPGMTHDLALLCKGTLAANPPQSWPDDTYPYAQRGRSRAQPTDAGGKFFAVSKESSIVEKCVFRQEAAVQLCSAALSTDGSWPDVPTEGCAPLLWYREPDPGQTKGLGDGFLYVDHTYLQDSEMSAPHQNITPALGAICEQDLSPMAVWEFKDIVCATLPVMVAIRRVCGSREIFPWIACSDWEKEGLPYKTRCEGTGCNTPEGTYRISGRCARFDSPMIEDFLCRAAERKDIGLSSYKVEIKAGDLRTAIFILQQIWSQLVTIDGTVAVINGGNYELICIRHRATQSLFLSDIHYIPGNRLDSVNISFAIPGPTHMNLHTGLVSLITADAIQRAKLIRAAEGIKETRLPSRMRDASKFNMSPWRAGWHRDTKAFVSKKLPPLIPWKEGLDAFRKVLVKSTCIQLRFCGTNAKLFSSEKLDAQNALRLENVDDPIANGEAPSSAMEIIPAVGILRRPKKSGIGGIVTCNLAVTGSYDRYYNGSFLGLLATNSDDVTRLIDQFHVHEAFERMGNHAAEKVQYHLGCFVNRDHSFGVLFLENIPEKAYLPLSDPNVQHTKLSEEVINEIEAFFELPSFAHRSLMAWNIYVKTGSSDPGAKKLFYVTEWRYGKVWELPLTAELHDDRKLEKAKDKDKLMGILDAVRSA